jgi:HEAT repeat protein
MNDAVLLLAESLMHEDQRVRQAAVEALVDLDPPPGTVLPAIQKVLKQADEQTRDLALDALASIGEDAVPELIEALQHREVRAKAAAILARIGPQAKDAVGPLSEALKDEDPDTREEVLFAIAAIGPDAAAAVPAVIKALEDPDMNVRYGACYALGRIGPAVIEAKPALTEQLDAVDPFLDLATAWALARIHPECSKTAPKTVPKLAKGLQQEEPLVRAEACQALGCLGPLAKQAVPALKEALNNENELVRESAAAALEAIENPEE